MLNNKVYVLPVAQAKATGPFQMLLHDVTLYCHYYISVSSTIFLYTLSKRVARLCHFGWYRLVKNLVLGYIVDYIKTRNKRNSCFKVLQYRQDLLAIAHFQKRK